MFDFLKKLFGFGKLDNLQEPVIVDAEKQLAAKIEELIGEKVESTILTAEHIVEKIEEEVPLVKPVVEEVVKKVRKSRAPRKPKETKQ